jgi:hypothetical protein
VLGGKSRKVWYKPMYRRSMQRTDSEVVELKQIYCHRFSESSPLDSTHFLHFASGEETPRETEICLAALSAVQQCLLSSPSSEIRRPSKSFFRFLNGWAPDLGYRVDNLIPQSDSLLRQQLPSVTLDWSQ